jgi:hypothetical protein
MRREEKEREEKLNGKGREVRVYVGEHALTILRTDFLDQRIKTY